MSCPNPRCVCVWNAEREVPLVCKRGRSNCWEWTFASVHITNTINLGDVYGNEAHTAGICAFLKVKHSTLISIDQWHWRMMWLSSVRGPNYIWFHNSYKKWIWHLRMYVQRTLHLNCSKRPTAARLQWQKVLTALQRLASPCLLPPAGVVWVRTYSYRVQQKVKHDQSACSY